MQLLKNHVLKMNNDRTSPFDFTGVLRSILFENHFNKMDIHQIQIVFMEWVDFSKHTIEELIIFNLT